MAYLCMGATEVQPWFNRRVGICVQILAFSTEAVGAVVDSYLPIVQKQRDMPYTEQNKEWQQMRRRAHASCSAAS